MKTIFPMEGNVRSKLPNLFWVSGLVGVATLAGMVFQARVSRELTLHHWQDTALRLAPLLAVTAVILILGWFGNAAEKTTASFQNSLRSLRSWNWFPFSLVFAVFPLVVLSTLGGTVDPYFPRFWLFVHLAFAGALFCQAGWKQQISYARALALTLIVYGVAYQVLSYFPKVNNDPLTLDWSEASRYFYASLFFAKRIYGQAYALPTLHPSRYLLQSIPFLIPSLPIVAHRLWQVFLWVAFTGTTVLLLARRLKIQSRTTALLFTGWGYLFLMQGPVYYHLIACGLLVLWGFDRRRPWWRSMLVVIVASAWAGISRVNWLPVPGGLAAVLYLLETPMEERSRWWRYLLPPAAWAVVGLAVGFAVQRAYIPLSGAPAYEFDSSFSSPLLPYRLFPNATYPAGILIGLLLAAGPLVVLIVDWWLAARRSGSIRYHPIRVLGLAASLAVFLAGGILVSLKIGGGSNLHNLDAFLFFLLVIGSYLFFGRFVPDDPSGQTAGAKHREHGLSSENISFSQMLHPYKNWVVLALVLALPLLPNLQIGGPVPVPPAEQRQSALATLQATIDAVPPASGEILFISGRELVTFYQIQAKPLELDFETVFLMEMAMANQPRYLGDFERDLSQHRFALIIAAPLGTAIQNSENGFAEENNAWVKHVSGPVLKYYRVKTKLDDIGLQILEPRP